MAKRMDSLPCRSGHGSDDIDLAKGICEGCRVERVRRQLEDLREGCASDAARALMRSHLRDLPRRRAHSEGVARAMGGLYGTAHPTVRDVAIAAGLVHDIGYGTVRTGLHSLDGATALEGTSLQFLAPLVAWHSTAAQESATRGIPIEVPQPEDPRIRAALWVADFSTSPVGRPIAPVDRIADIRERYAPDSPVIAALDAGMVDFIAALRLWGRHGEADAVGAAVTATESDTLGEHRHGRTDQAQGGSTMMAIDEALQEAIAAFDRDEMTEGARHIERVLETLYPYSDREDPMDHAAGFALCGTAIHALIGWVREGRLDRGAVTLDGVCTLLEQGNARVMPVPGADQDADDRVLWLYVKSRGHRDSKDPFELMALNYVRQVFALTGARMMYERLVDLLFEGMAKWRPVGAADEGTVQLMIEDVERWSKAPA